MNQGSVVVDLLDDDESKDFDLTVDLTVDLTDDSPKEEGGGSSPRKRPRRASIDPTSPDPAAAPLSQPPHVIFDLSREPSLPRQPAPDKQWGHLLDIFGPTVEALAPRDTRNEAHDEYIVGRSVKRADIVVSHPRVSSTHCRIFRERRVDPVGTSSALHVVLEDTSANGTSVHGADNTKVLLRKGQRRDLHSGDRIYLVPFREGREAAAAANAAETPACEKTAFLFRASRAAPRMATSAAPPVATASSSSSSSSSSCSLSSSSSSSTSTTSFSLSSSSCSHASAAPASVLRFYPPQHGEDNGGEVVDNSSDDGNGSDDDVAVLDRGGSWEDEGGFGGFGGSGAEDESGSPSEAHLRAAVRDADARAAQLAADEAEAQRLQEHEERKAQRRAERAAADDDGRDVLREVRDSIPAFLNGPSCAGWTFDLTSLVVNPASAPGQALYERFLEAWTETDMKVRLVFHGTPEANIPAIFREGLDPKRRTGQAFGKGEYFGATAAVSAPYCRGQGTRLIVFAVLTDPSGITVENANIVVVHKPEHQLPLASAAFAGAALLPCRRAPAAAGMAGNPFNVMAMDFGALIGFGTPRRLKAKEKSGRRGGKWH